MRRIIPPKTKIRTNLFKNFNLFDLLIVVIFLIFAALFLSTHFSLKLRLFISMLILVIGITTVGQYGHFKGYEWLNIYRKYLFSKKAYKPKEMQNLMELDISDDNISLCGVFSSVIEVSPIEFIFYKEDKQLQILSQFSNIFKNIKSGSIVKIEKPIIFTHYIERYKSRVKEVLEEKEEYIAVEKKKAANRHKALDETKLNLKQFDNVLEILYNTINYLSYNDIERQINAEVYYFVFYEKNRENLKNTEREAISILTSMGLSPYKLKTDDINEFLSFFTNSNSEKFECPTISQSMSSIKINDMEKKIFTIGKYPVFAEGNNWASDFFSISGTSAVLNFNRSEVESVKKSINKTIIELNYRFYNERQATEQQSLQNQIEALSLLLQQFDYNNESISSANFYIMCDAKQSEYKRIKSIIEPRGFKLNSLPAQQLDAWFSMFPGIGSDLLPKFSRGLQSSTLAAAFPFISNLFMDYDGDYIGDFRYPVFFDMWQRNGRRVNSNACIVGQTGSGKTYFQKALLKHQRVRGTKLFVLDCESEYGYMADKLGGTVIEMTGGVNGIINPFQVFPSFVADELTFLNERRIELGDVINQRLFLSEWFKSLLPMELDTKSVLESQIQELYEDFKIYDSTDISKLSAKDFPTFNDLQKKVDASMKTKGINDYDLGHLRKLGNYLKLFAENGNYSRLWNGPTSLDIVGDFVVFDFQQLFANSNKEVCNAQMMLIMRLLMREVINIKKRNEQQDSKEKVLVLVDEVHRYISSQFPIALDTIYQFAKRIRKYSGSLIVATQNIGDYMGNTEAVRTMATGIINNCQYNMLFGLKADDINKAQELYMNYGDGLIAEELQFLTSAKLGQMLFMAEPESRQVVQVSLMPDEEQYLIPPK